MQLVYFSISKELPPIILPIVMSSTKEPVRSSNNKGFVLKVVSYLVFLKDKSASNLRPAIFAIVESNKFLSHVLVPLQYFFSTWSL